MKDKGTAVVLALLLGSIGIHRFYLEQWVYGILYLLFSWTFIPLIISIIDFLIFLVMSKESFDTKYNKAKVAGGWELKTSATGVAEELEKLHDLMEKGIITKQEFESKKAKLL